MKLFKRLGIILFAFLMITLSGCSTSFCSTEDIANIKNGLMTKIENNTGEGYYAQPNYDALSEAGLSIEKLKAEGAVIADGTTTITWAELGELKNAQGENVGSTFKQQYVDYVYNTYHPKACLVDEDHEDEISGGVISGKNFSYAFKQGLLELLAFPFSWGIVSIANLLGGGEPTGFTLMLGVFLVTFIIRTIMLAATFKSTAQTQKIQALQPQINAINAKYANKNDATSKNQKAMEMMNLYKKHNVNPLSSMVTPFITLPVFIAVYSAVKDTTIIFESTLLGLNLGDKLGATVMKFNWFAIVLFIVMAVLQFLTMRLPQWLGKRNQPEYLRNAAKGSQAAGQQNMMSYFFLIMIIVISWMLPLAMSIYWIASSLYSVFQTLIMHKYTGKMRKKGA